MDEPTRHATLTIGKALKPDFAEMDAVFRKYILPDLEQLAAEKVATMSLEELEKLRRYCG
jgi:hypothetical protein